MARQRHFVSLSFLRRFFLHQSNLFHQSDLVVVEPLFRNLASIVPGGDGAKLHMEAPSRRLNYLTVGCFHLSFHCSIEIRNRTGVIVLLEQDLVGSIYQMVIGKSLEEFYSFQVMVTPSPSRFGLTGPVDGDVLSMTLSEGLPQRTLVSRVPSVI